MSPNPAPIFEKLRAFQETAALKSAIELGIFTAVAEGAATVPAIAAKCGASEKGIRVLCDVLAVDGLLLKRDGRYENTKDTKVFLVRSSPAYMGGVTEFLCDPQMTEAMFRTLTDCIRKGGTVMDGAGTVSDDNRIWVKFARAMGPITGMSAQFIAGHMPESGALKVLDIAAGHGMYGIGVARRNREAQIFGLDWEAVLEVAKENAAAAGITDRYHPVAGSAFETEFGLDYDAILLPNFLHHFNQESCGTILRKAYAALKPGGRVFTVEFVPDEDRVSPPISARFAMTMLFTTAEGDAYTFAEYDAMFRNAGFASTAHLLESQQSVIISTK